VRFEVGQNHTLMPQGLWAADVGVSSPTGDRLALMSGQSLQKAFIPLPGAATAVYTAAGLDDYRHSDWLGSSRFASTANPPTTMYADQAYAPFGEAYAQAGATNDLSFTGMDASTTTGDYDFPAREYDATAGRWPAPDPAGRQPIRLTLRVGAAMPMWPARPGIPLPHWPSRQPK
jgi:RHS repeat-associated protein